MVEKKEAYFADLTLPLVGLRAHAEYYGGKVHVSGSIKNHEELKSDLEAALDAGRRGEGDWLTGRDLVAEVQDENSPHHGQSAFRILTRAAAFEEIFSRTGGRFPLCPNMEIQGLSVPVKPIRDYLFRHQKGETDTSKVLAGFFPAEVQNKERYAEDLARSLEFARKNDGSKLTGGEVLEQAEIVFHGAVTCADLQLLDHFWETAVVSAWINGDKSLPVEDVGGRLAVETPIPSDPPSTPPTQVPGWTPVIPYYPGGNFGAEGPQNPLQPPPVWIPGNPAQPPAQPGGDAEVFNYVREAVGGTADLALVGGGIHFQRGVVAEYQMIFKPVTADGKTTFALAEVDRLPKIRMPAELADQARLGDPKLLRSGMEPLDMGEFKKAHPKIHSKGIKEAEILWRRAAAAGGELPEGILRTGVRRGWIKGSLSLRRVAGWGAAVWGLGDLFVRFLRKDEKGLEGPITELGALSVEEKLASIGGWEGAASAALLGGVISMLAPGYGETSSKRGPWVH